MELLLLLVVVEAELTLHGRLHRPVDHLALLARGSALTLREVVGEVTATLADVARLARAVGVRLLGLVIVEGGGVA